jgi:hypothetical protein
MVNLKTETGIDYEFFLDSKRQSGGMTGFKPTSIPDYLFDFQKYLVDWSLRKGKSAIFADCGLGKTPMQLVWADNVLYHTNRPVLILTPLAVSAQTVREGEKFGIKVIRSQEGKISKSIIVANYERLHYFNPGDFSGVVCDESSILKSFDGVRRTAITEFMRRVPYRLLCTATAAPNDYIELGTSSEALGELGYTDMLGRFFVNNRNNIATSRMRFADVEWRLKGHAEIPFWRWVCSWSRAIRKPSDLGYQNGKFSLPKMIERETIVKAKHPRPDMLFDIAAIGLQEEREVRRRTINERCEAAAQMVKGNDPAVLWCHLNDEGDTLAGMIPDGDQISGQDADEKKEETFEAFRTGQLSKLIIKPKIGAFGLNWQHCAHVVYFVSHSYEQYYQAVRRCWRFGQTKDVIVDLIRTDGEERILENLQRKSLAADTMFTNLVAQMNNVLTIDKNREFIKKEVIPEWL